jgi:hypothetical protein
MSWRKTTSMNSESPIEMDEGYILETGGSDRGETSPMIGVPAALAAILLVGGLMTLAVIFFISPFFSMGQTRSKDSKSNEGFGDLHPARNTKIAPFFAPQVKQWEPQIVAWADEWGLDANLVATVMQIESCGDRSAVSRSGALGLFQVMPYHFQTDEDVFDPEVNARRGIAYLRQAYNARQGDFHATFASYNGGIQGASLPESAWPEETQRYAHWGMGIFTEAQSGSPDSPTLNAWMKAGGESLCLQASQHLASINK